MQLKRKLKTDTIDQQDAQTVCNYITDFAPLKEN